MMNLFFIFLLAWDIDIISQNIYWDLIKNFVEFRNSHKFKLVSPCGVCLRENYVWYKFTIILIQARHNGFSYGNYDYLVHGIKTRKFLSAKKEG